MIRLVYSSAARAGIDEAELKRILESARARNARREVTGMLLYRDGVFLQLLEGQEVDVRYVFTRIAQDPRHQRVVKLMEEAITQRDFASWSMGYQVLTPAHLDAIAPPDPVTRKPSVNMGMLEVDAPLATRLLLSFAQPMGFASA